MAAPVWACPLGARQPPQGALQRMAALCSGLAPDTPHPGPQRHAGPSPVSESIVVIVGTGPTSPGALRAPSDAGVVDGEAVQGWRWQPGWRQREESSESPGYMELQAGVPSKVGSEPLPLVPLHGSAPPLGTTVTLESQITFCEA